MTLPSDYQVHMLRIWHNPSAKDNEKNSLRMTIENTQTAIRVSFSDFETLTNYLQQQTEMLADF